MEATGNVEQPRGPGGTEQGSPELGDTGAAGQLVFRNPWNMMIKHRQVQRRGHRPQITTNFTDPSISMALLRAVLQPRINKEIQIVFNKYMKFFQKAALKVQENVGEDVDAEELIQDACQNCLEQAKLLFPSREKVMPRSIPELPGIKRARQAEKECAHRESPIPKKRKKRPLGHMISNDRAAAGKVRKPKSCEPNPREGPKWDPARLNESTTFVLGSQVNKALGMGGTRRRNYIKHPYLFKYAADPQDKHWLFEQHHLLSTEGKMACLLIEENIRDLAASDDYRGSLDLKLEELKSFVLPSWIVEKMKKHMETLRRE